MSASPSGSGWKRFVGIRDGSPYLRISALLSSGGAAFLYAYYRGLIQFLETVGMGVTGTLDGLARWLYGPSGLVSALFGIPVAAADAAWTANIQFVTSTFGALSLPFIALEFGVIFWVVLEWGPTGLRYIWGGVAG